MLARTHGAIHLGLQRNAGGRPAHCGGCHIVTRGHHEPRREGGDATVKDLLTRLWRLGEPFQWRFLWLVHSKFICGITGVVRTDDGRVLLLRHRLWPPGRQSGFPTGYANKGERHEDTIAREVREETGLTVKAGQLLKVRSGFQYRIEIYYEADLAGGLNGLALDSREVLEARLFSLSDLPAGMPEAHRELAASL